MLVTAIASATELTVSRGYGTSAQGNGSAGDGVFIVGNVSEENAGARNVNTTRSAAQTNYTS